MFKKIVLALFLCVVLNPVVIAQECCEHSLINTEASINNEIEPDTAKIRFSVQNSGLNLDSIKEKNDKTVSDAINAIKANLNANESIKTTSFNVRNIYSYKDKVRVFQKYEVTNSFEVKIKNLTKISKIINLAMASGVKNVNGVDFLIENSEQLCNEMMAQAVKMAKNRAQYLATAAGSSLDKVKSINPYCSLSSSHIQPKLNKVYSSAAVDSASFGENVIESIEAGTINARASVNMVHFLK